MRTIKKAYAGTLTPSSSSVSSRMGSYGKKMKSGGTLAPTKKSVGKTIGKLNKAKSGTSLGMKSVKAGYDSNPGVTRADIIVAGKGQAKKGMKVKKAQTGVKQELYNLRNKDKTTRQTIVADTTGYSAGAKKFPATFNTSKGTSSGTVSRKQVDKMIKNPKMGGYGVKGKTGVKMTKKCAYGCK